MQKLTPVQLPLIDDLSEVDTILNRAIAAGDPLIATNYGNELHRTAFLKGVSLAKLLYGLRDNWGLFLAAGIGEDFEDFVSAHMLNIDSSTADRYANMYESVFVKADISDDLRNRLKLKPIRSLLLLTAAVREGSIGEEQLQSAVLKNEAGIRKMVKEARGYQTKSRNAITALIVTRDNSTWGPPGTIVVFQNGDNENLGILNLNPKKEFTKQYLERIKNTLAIGEMR
jgi:hypothetical protein